MNKFIFILFIFFIGCSGDDSIEYTKVSVSYLHNLTITEGEWIEIDGNKLFHVNSAMEMNSTTMPVSNYIVDKVEDKEWKSKVNYIGMGIKLARAIENLSNDNVKYIVEKDFDLQMLGKVKVTRSDGNPINIRYSNEYPVLVESFE